MMKARFGVMFTAMIVSICMLVFSFIGGGLHPSADNLFHNEDERIMNAMRAMLDDVHMPDEFTIEHVSAMLDE